MTKTVDLDIPHSSEERVRREAESTLRYRERVVEVLRRYNIVLPDAPLDMLAMAMKRLAEGGHRNERSPNGTRTERAANDTAKSGG